jgi:hypothetical protein
MQFISDLLVSKQKTNPPQNISAEKKAELEKELKPLIDQHKKLWVVRNRPGGLDDSAGKMENLLKAYKIR